MSDAPVATTQPTTQKPAPPNPSSPLRTLVLIAILLLGVGALAYDYAVARPASIDASQRMEKLIDSPQGVFSPDDVQQALGRKPTLIDQRDHALIEVYSWRGGMPIRTYDLYVVYSRTGSPLLYSFKQGTSWSFLGKRISKDMPQDNELPQAVESLTSSPPPEGGPTAHDFPPVSSPDRSVGRAEDADEDGGEDEEQENRHDEGEDGGSNR